MIGQTLSFLPLEFNDVDYMKIENGIYDDVYATHINEDVKNPNEFVVPDSWDRETYLHAKFNGDLFSGNADIGVKNTSNLIVKRREEGTYKWMPLFNIEVDSSADFNFTVIDYFAASNTTYEYAVVPIVNNEEGAYSISEPCEVSFDNLVIIDKEDKYSTIFDISVSQQKNNTSSVVIPIQSKYPIYVANAYNDYYTGNISATFINMNCTNMNPSIKEVNKYRTDVLNFLNNRKIKFIKDPDGRCWIAAIGTAISDEENGHPYAHKISFDFTEVGDTNSNRDMNTFGFLDLGEEWWI